MTRTAPMFRDALLAACLLVLLLLIALRLGDGKETRLDGPFYVIDGDTLAVDGDRLRLHGIDAPELDQTCRDERGETWACGQAARHALLRLVDSDDVQCSGSGHDRYGRLLVECDASVGSVNRSMVERGLALASGAYQSEEGDARKARRGIWAGDFETPRRWRREHDATAKAGLLDDLWGRLRSLFGWVAR